jgi:hypothetical protein
MAASKPIVERVSELKAEGLSREELISRLMMEKYNMRDIVKALKISVHEIGRISCVSRRTSGGRLLIHANLNIFNIKSI